MSSFCLLESVAVVFSLVYRLMGRVKEVKDSTAGPDNSYYTSLLNSKSEVLPLVRVTMKQIGDCIITQHLCIILQSSAEKQILLDLHRTLPSNTHFRSTGHGVSVV